MFSSQKLISCTVLAALTAPLAGFAQSTPPPSSTTQGAQPIDTSGWSAPPVVDAPPPPATPGVAPSAPSDAPRAPLVGAATPPPPGYQQPPPSTYSTQPGMGGMPATPYGSSPYGSAPNPYTTAPLEAPPGPEIGLIVTESLFGVLTAGGTALLSYYLVVKPLALTLPADDPTSATIANVVFLASFASVALGTAQTETSIANGSRYYLVDSWIPTLGAVVGQAAAIGLYALTRDSSTDGGEAVLLIGTTVAVPAFTTLAMNLFKTPRFKTGFNGVGGLLNYSPENGLQAGLPTPAPMITQTGHGPTLGFGFNVLGGRF